ncbi:MAG: choice-of-anchor tandem repeat GloVer-containing protein, partial [bacterium]
MRKILFFSLLFLITLFTVHNVNANTTVSKYGSFGRALPSGSFTLFTDGKMYGVTRDGGTMGTIFSFNPTNNSLATVYSFSGSSLTGDPGGPTGGLAVDSEKGILYGVTAYGGLYGALMGKGVIFSYEPTAIKKFKILYVFPSDSSNGLGGDKSLIMGKNGVLYGVNQNLFFSFDPNSGVFSSISGFRKGENPNLELTIDQSDGTIYGSTKGLDVAIDSKIFSYNQNDGFKTLSLSSSIIPSGPVSINPSDGLLYGTADLDIRTLDENDIYSAIFSLNPKSRNPGETLSIRHKLYWNLRTHGLIILPNGVSTSSPDQDTHPYYILPAEDGKLYGASAGGLVDRCGSAGCTGFGSLFSFDPVNNDYKKIFYFNANNGSGVNSYPLYYNKKFYGSSFNNSIINQSDVLVINPQIVIPLIPADPEISHSLGSCDTIAQKPMTNISWTVTTANLANIKYFEVWDSTKTVRLTGTNPIMAEANKTTYSFSERIDSGRENADFRYYVYAVGPTGLKSPGLNYTDATSGSGCTAMATPAIIPDDGTCNTIYFHWAPISGATKYNIFDSNKNIIATTTTTSYSNTFTSTQPYGTGFGYYVMAKNDSRKTSALSEMVTVTTGSCLPKLNDPIATSSPNACNRVRFIWSPIDGADTYKFYSATSTYIGRVTGTSAYWQITDFSTTTFTYFIQAYNSSTGQSSNRVSITAMTYGCAPETPNPTVQPSACGVVNFTWPIRVTDPASNEGSLYVITH